MPSKSLSRSQVDYKDTLHILFLLLSCYLHFWNMNTICFQWFGGSASHIFVLKVPPMFYLLCFPSHTVLLCYASYAILLCYPMLSYAISCYPILSYTVSYAIAYAIYAISYAISYAKSYAISCAILLCYPMLSPVLSSYAISPMLSIFPLLTCIVFSLFLSTCKLCGSLPSSFVPSFYGF